MRFLILASTALLLSACQTTRKEPKVEVPLTLQTIGPAYADYAVEKADTNKDGGITLVEWMSAGGTPRSFAMIDENKDSRVSRSELIRVGSNAQFLVNARKYIDPGADTQLTPRDFRSPAGVRFLRLEF